MISPVDAVTKEVAGVLSDILGRQVSDQEYVVKVLTPFVLKWYHQGAIDAIDKSLNTIAQVKKELA